MGKATSTPNGKRSLISKFEKELQEYFEALRNTPLAFKLVWSSSKTAATVGIFLMLIAAILPAGEAWVGKLIIDSVVEAAEMKMSMAQGVRFVLPYLILEFALVFIHSLASQLRSLSDRVLQSKLTNHINSLIMRKAINLDLQFFENPIFYDTLQNARRRADTSALSIVRSSLQMVQQVITLISFIVLLLRFSVWLAIIVFLAAIPSFLSQSQFAERAFRAISRRAPESRLLNYLEMLLTGN
jgi:ATP-binding cassette subfamily B protein